MSSPQSICTDSKPGIGLASATHQENNDQFAAQRTKLSINKNGSSHFRRPLPLQALKVAIEQIFSVPEFQQQTDLSQNDRVKLCAQLRQVVAAAYADFKGKNPFPLQEKNTFRKMVDEIIKQLPHAVHKTILQNTVDKVLAPEDAHRNVPLSSVRS